VSSGLSPSRPVAGGLGPTRRWPRTAAVAVAGFAAALMGCGEGGDAPAAPAASDAAPAPQALLPPPPGAFAPAMTAIGPGDGIDGRYLSDTGACADCHPDAAAQWNASAHAMASFSNPIYRTSIDEFRADVGLEASRFCGGCHDPALLVDGALDVPVAAADARAHAGVSCRVCHGVVATTRDGNGSYTLAANPLPVPIEGDEASVRRHRDAVRVSELGADLCISCHRSFLNHATGNPETLFGQDEAADWQDSPYAGAGAARIDDPIEPKDCLGCHMPNEPAPRGDAAAEDGHIASHRFAGGHTWLAAMLGDPEQLAHQREMLARAITVDVAAVRTDGRWTLPADGAPVEPGAHLELDVVIRNRGVGHRFPAGVRDAQDTWLEVTVRDARGQILGRSGHGHAADPADDEAHVLRAMAAGDDGRLLLERQVHRFRGAIADHTVKPRDAVAVRYALEVPADLASDRLPLAVEVRVRHRSRNLALQARACAAATDAEGRAFGRASAVHRGVELDPCAAQPLTTVAEARVELGAGAAPADPDRTWLRLYEHGMALAAAMQERLDEARPSLEAALAAAGGPEADRRRAMVLVQLGRVAGRQGRTGEAIAYLERAEALVPGATAIAAMRAEALAYVWRWDEAASARAAVVDQVPGNGGAWRKLAIALGALGRSDDALEAARRGLALRPRDGDLLRVQALALRALAGDTLAADLALEAYAGHRAPDLLQEVRIRCAAASEACARERQPVHVHRLR
jgi:tetratricopeptide (TPR) repeat protein